MFACRYGYKDIVEFLHGKGAVLERDRGYCALHVACYGGDWDTVKYLLEEAKVNPNPETQDRLPLYIALSSNVTFSLSYLAETLAGAFAEERRPLRADHVQRRPQEREGSAEGAQVQRPPAQDQRQGRPRPQHGQDQPRPRGPRVYQGTQLCEVELNLLCIQEREVPKY